MYSKYVETVDVMETTKQVAAAKAQWYLVCMGSMNCPHDHRLNFGYAMRLGRASTHNKQKLTSVVLSAAVRQYITKQYLIAAKHFENTALSPTKL